MNVIVSEGFILPEAEEEVGRPTICDTTKALTYWNNGRAPCDWIDKVKEWADENPSVKYLNTYVTDYMMKILWKFREGKFLTNDEYELIDNINLAIKSTPTPKESFVVARGIHYQGYDISPGKIISDNMIRSGSFNIETVLEGYVSGDPTESGVMLIHVPIGAVVGYHPSEDQVIFPSNAQFLVTSDIIETEVEAFGGKEITTQFECIYIDDSVVNHITNIELYKNMLRDNYMFPFRPITKISTSKWTMDVSNYPPDVIYGMYFAVPNLKYERHHMVPSDKDAYTIETNYGVAFVTHADEFLQGAITMWKWFDIFYVINYILDANGNYLTITN